MKLLRKDANPTNSKNFVKVKAYVGKTKTIYAIPGEKHNKLGQTEKPLIGFSKVKDMPKRKVEVGQNTLPEGTTHKIEGQFSGK